jgi:hypothetical protein
MSSEIIKEQNLKTSVSEITLEDLKTYIIYILNKNSSGLALGRISDRASRNCLFKHFSAMDRKVAIFKLVQENKIIKFKGLDSNGKPANSYKVNESHNPI